MVIRLCISRNQSCGNFTSQFSKEFRAVWKNDDFFILTQIPTFFLYFPGMFCFCKTFIKQIKHENIIYEVYWKKSVVYSAEKKNRKDKLHHRSPTNKLITVLMWFSCCLVVFFCFFVLFCFGTYREIYWK